MQQKGQSERTKSTRTPSTTIGGSGGLRGVGVATNREVQPAGHDCGWQLTRTRDAGFTATNSANKLWKQTDH